MRYAKSMTRSKSGMGNRLVLFPLCMDPPSELPELYDHHSLEQRPPGMRTHEFHNVDAVTNKDRMVIPTVGYNRHLVHLGKLSVNRCWPNPSANVTRVDSLQIQTRKCDHGTL